MQLFLDEHYHVAAIGRELSAAHSIYHLLLCDGVPAGFSKIVPDSLHGNVPPSYTRLDCIYLLGQYHNKGLGLALLEYNIALSKTMNQEGMWLFTWQGNERAIAFYRRNGFDVIAGHRFKVTEDHYNPHYQMLLRYA